MLHPEKLAKWPQVPFHFAGGGPKPSPLKLWDSGVIPDTRFYTNNKIGHNLYYLKIEVKRKNGNQASNKNMLVFSIPVSKRPTTMSLSLFKFLLAVNGNPMKFHDFVVCSL